MSLTPGTRIGVYQIAAQIGVGGMGEVYQATDTNLKRQVAIKVLPASVAGDAERLARFQREAEVLAALNHPNIAAIYGLEKTPDFTALVMELVEGDDLSQRLARGAIPLDEALPIAKQIAEALEAAHEQGIIHRDLKPANIKVRPDGTVKVLDFGLAKAMESQNAMSPEFSQAPTITTPAMTQAGMILGTAAYMSPEQAKGKTVDKRSDVWAFGAVLYEMLTGSRPFEAEDVSETLAAVLMKEPDWSRVPGAVPPAVLALLQGCLVKNRKDRVGDISSALFTLRHLASLDGAEREATAPPAAPVRPWWTRAPPSGRYSSVPRHGAQARRRRQQLSPGSLSAWQRVRSSPLNRARPSQFPPTEPCCCMLPTASCTCAPWEMSPRGLSPAPNSARWEHPGFPYLLRMDNRSRSSPSATPRSVGFPSLVARR